MKQSWFSLDRGGRLRPAMSLAKDLPIEHQRPQARCNFALAAQV
jgi:hypothetical protein